VTTPRHGRGHGPKAAVVATHGAISRAIGGGWYVEN